MIGRRAITRVRADGVTTWDSSGEPVRGSDTSTPIMASVQPIKKDQIQRLPEGHRVDMWIWLSTESDLITVDQSAAGSSDRVIVDGITYEINMVDDWSNGLIPHYEAFAVRVKE